MSVAGVTKNVKVTRVGPTPSLNDELVTKAYVDPQGLITVKTADQSVTSSTTLVNVTDLLVTGVAGEKFLIEWHLFVDSAAAPDLKLQCTVGSGTLVGGSSSVSNGVVTSVAFGTSAAMASANWPMHVVYKTALSITVAGTLNLQFAQNTSNGTPTTILAGSYMKVLQIV